MESIKSLGVALRDALFGALTKHASSLTSIKGILVTAVAADVVSMGYIGIIKFVTSQIALVTATTPDPFKGIVQLAIIALIAAITMKDSK